MDTPLAKSMKSDESLAEWLIALLLIVGSVPLILYLAIKLVRGGRASPPPARRREARP